MQSDAEKQQQRSARQPWVKTERGERPTDQRTQEIVFQIESGRDYKDIAWQFGVSRARISHIARRLGLPDGRKGPRKSRKRAAHLLS